jgi:rhodanese-related sulfurtransferase
MKIVFGFFVFALIAFSCKDKRVSSTAQAVYKNVDVAQAKQLIANNPNLVLLDVRTPEETKEGMIDNAIEIDFYNSNFETEINKLDKTKSYLVYCRSGGRSVSACEKMIDAGFTDLTNMKGGYSAWK